METIAKSKSFVRSDEVIGVSVINNANEDLGEIYEIVIDKFSGIVKYVVLNTGSFLGLGGKFFAVPWNSIKYDNVMKAFVLNIKKEKLAKAPGFDKENWPSMSNIDWAASVDSYYTSSATNF